MTHYCSRIFSFTISLLLFTPCYANFFDFAAKNLNSTDHFFKFATSVCEMVANKNIDTYQYPKIIKKEQHSSIMKGDSDAYYDLIELEKKDDENDIKFTYAVEVENLNYLIIEYETGMMTFTFFDIGKNVDIHKRTSEQARGQLKLNVFKNCRFESIDFEGNGLKSVDEFFLKNDTVIKMLDTYLKNKKLTDKSSFEVNKNYLYVSSPLKQELPTKKNLHKTLVLQFDAGIDYSGPLTKYLSDELSALEKKQILVTLNDALERRLDRLQKNRDYSIDNLGRIHTLTKVSSYSSILGFTLGSRYPHALHLMDGLNPLTHGTITAGIILRGAESYPIHLFPVSLSSLNSKSTHEIERDAINLLKSLNPRVVNISLGELKKNEAIYYDKMFKDNPNTLFVIAAGNESLNFEEATTIEYYPVMFKYPNTLVVGATTSPLENGDIGEKLASSNYGRNMVDIMARGENHISIHPGENVFRISKERGTSLAAPFVSNIAAKMFSIAPHLDAVTAKAILLKYAKKVKTFELFVQEGRYIDEDVENTIVKSLIRSSIKNK